MISGVTMRINIDEYLMNALKEDITQEDVSTNAVMPEPKQGKVNLICKQDGVICGLEVFERVFKLLDETVVFETELKDGDKVTKGQLMGVVKGDIRALLSGERVALNYLQRMSGIATMTSELAKELEVPILCLCQLSRNVEQRTNHRPALSDLRDSGAIEQDADQVFFIYREDYYNNNKDDKAQGNNQSDIPPEPPIEGEEPNGQSAPSSGNSMVELILAKNRSGELATFKFMFMKQFCRFESIYDGDDYQG